MTHSAKYSYGEKSEIACQCGCVLTVSYTKQDGHNEKEEFKCPKCGFEHSVRAAMPINEVDIVCK